GGDPLGIEVAGIALDRDLGPVQQLEAIPTGPEHGTNLVRLEQAGGATTEEDAVRRHRRLPLDLELERLDVARDQLEGVRLSIEVTVGADRLAPGNVQVDPGAASYIFAHPTSPRSRGALVRTTRHA